MYEVAPVQVPVRQTLAEPTAAPDTVGGTVLTGTEALTLKASAPDAGDVVYVVESLGVKIAA